MDEPCDIAVIGAGAAGLAAAIFAAQRLPTARVVLLDGAARVGAKILVSGGGRCNVVHRSVGASDFNADQSFVRHVLAAFDHNDAIDWFASLGISLKQEPSGKLFPTTNRAQTVLDALLARCQQLRIPVLRQHRVHSVDAVGDDDGPRFAIRHEAGILATNRVIMATGGRSLPRTGSDGQGWRIVQSLGHSVTPTYPALVPLVLEPSFFHRTLQGISQEVELSTYQCGKQIDRRRGSLLWTHFGISGPVVLDASRFWVIAHTAGEKNSDHAQVRCSFVPDTTFHGIEQWLVAAAARSPKRSAISALSEKLPKQMASVLAGHAGVKRNASLGQMRRDDRRRLVHCLTELLLPVVRDRGWNYAEVTAGGVPLQEVEYRSMASKRVKGLYLAGEMLECEGKIGGFNFQWAWSTGHLAGCAAAASLP